MMLVWKRRALQKKGSGEEIDEKNWPDQIIATEANSLINSSDARLTPRLFKAITRSRCN